VFAIPAIIAIGVGAGLAQGHLGGGVLISLAGALFGLALSKWISISVGSLIRKKRTRGETLLALLGVIAGLGGALFGQIAPVLFRHAESITALRWTPPGAIAYALTHGLRDGNTIGYTFALLAISAYTAILIAISFWLARRSILGGGSNDFINGGNDNDKIDGGAGDDSLYGGEGKDTILGGDGNDYLDGDAGADSVNAGNGNDTVFTDEVGDIAAGGAGVDTLFADVTPTKAPTGFE